MPTYNYTTINDAGAASTMVLAINLGGNSVVYSENSVSTGLASASFLYDDGTLTPIVPPGALSSVATDINIEGVIVGTYDTKVSADGFIDDHGQYTTLKDPDGVSAVARGINAFGTVVGNYYDSSGGEVGFIYDHGTYTTISIPGAKNTYGASINDLGVVAGHADLSGSGSTDYIYDHGTYTEIIPPGGIATGTNVSINDCGELVGSYTTQTGRGFSPAPIMGFIYDHGTYTTITAPAATNITPMGLNNSGAIVGTYNTSSSLTQGFVYADSTFTTIDVPGASETYPTAINDLGQIVGFYYDSSGTHGFVATPQGLDKTWSFLSDLVGDLSKCPSNHTSAACNPSWTNPTGTIHHAETDNSGTCSHSISCLQSQ